MSADWNKVLETVSAQWDSSLLPALSAFIEVPNQSPDYDPEWATNGLMDKAMSLMIEWMKEQNVEGLTYELIKDEGRTPFLFIEIAGTSPTAKSVLMYGHMDKQPPLRPWDDGLDPHKAVVRDGKLYGRGGADDGYAFYASVACVKVLQMHKIPHGRIVITIEAGEESGSPDLDHYMEKTDKRIGDVDLMICLDSGCLNYDQVWLTTSLRGVGGGVLKVQTLTEGMHSGVAGGVVPDSFRIARELLDRVEDSRTGEVLIPEAHCEIPAHVMAGMEAVNSVDFKGQFALAEGVSSEPGDNVELAVRNFWKPSLTITGANLPETAIAGNVIRKTTELKLSLRVPPLVSSKAASAALKRVLEANPPYNAKVSFVGELAGDGCATPELAPWLSSALDEASKTAYGKTFACQGMGGAIPFIGMLVKKYPAAQFIVTGILGPKSNAHGPNEFLHISYVKGITYSIVRVLAEHFHNTPKA